MLSIRLSGNISPAQLVEVIGEGGGFRGGESGGAMDVGDGISDK